MFGQTDRLCLEKDTCQESNEGSILHGSDVRVVLLPPRSTDPSNLEQVFQRNQGPQTVGCKNGIPRFRGFMTNTKPPPSLQ